MAYLGVSLASVKLTYNYNKYLGAMKPEQGQAQVNQHTSLCKSATIWPLNTTLEINNAKSMNIFQVSQFSSSSLVVSTLKTFHSWTNFHSVLAQPLFYKSPPSLVAQMFISTSMSTAVLQYIYFLFIQCAQSAIICMCKLFHQNIFHLQSPFLLF